MIFSSKSSYISFHKTIDIATGENDFDQVQYCVVELPKYRRLAATKSRKLEYQWLDFLANAKDQKSIPPGRSKVVKGAYQSLEIIKWDPITRAAYLKAEMDARYSKEILEDSHDQREAKGRAEGIVEGRAESERAKQLEIARKMKSRGYKIADIAEDTGLLISEIKQL